ncbi:hypothetical protein RCL1_008741 [Eukaryota sp. TZLM3-RCL]
MSTGNLHCLEPNCPVLYSQFQRVTNISLPEIGNQSSCFVVKDQNNKLYFVKVMQQDLTGCKEELARFNSPIESPYLIRYLHCYQDVASTIFVMEYHEGGSLHRFIEDERKANRPPPFSEQDIWCIFCQILSGVDLLHQAKIIHRDLKLANILLESRKRPFKIKICDFGISKELVGTIGRTMTGSPGYIAPEVQQSSASYGPAVDYFSLGVILYQLTQGSMPFRPHPQYPIYTDFNTPVRISPSNPFNQIISGLLAIDPSKRFNFDMLMSFPKIRNWFYPAIIEQCKCAQDVMVLKSENEELRTDVELLQQLVKEKSVVIESVQGDLLAFKNEVASLLSSQNKEISDLKSTVQELSLKKEDSTLQEDLLALKRSVYDFLTFKQEAESHLSSQKDEIASLKMSKTIQQFSVTDSTAVPTIPLTSPCNRFLTNESFFDDDIPALQNPSVAPLQFTAQDTFTTQKWCRKVPKDEPMYSFGVDQPQTRPFGYPLNSSATNPMTFQKEKKFTKFFEI